MSKSDELLAEIDAAVERLNKAEMRRAALGKDSVILRMTCSEHKLAAKKLASEVGFESHRVAELMRRIVKECC